MPQETENVEGLNPFSERRQAHLGSRAFRLEEFDTAVGSGEQQQALKATTYTGSYAAGVLLIAQHPTLFALIGTTYGGDGRTTFGLPDHLYALGKKGSGRTTLLRNLIVQDHQALGVAVLDPHGDLARELPPEPGDAPLTSASIGGVSEDPAPIPKRAVLTGRPIGPVQFFEKLLEEWRLDEESGATLLGFEETSRLRDLLRGTVSLRGRDTEDRLAYLLDIDFSLSALFRDEESIRAWLRQPLEELGGETPLDHLLKGSMENLLRLKQLVEFLSGR